MITTSDYILTATVGGGKFHFEYEAGDVWDAIGEFWHDDYPDILDSLEGSEWFPLDVEALDGGKALPPIPSASTPPSSTTTTTTGTSPSTSSTSLSSGSGA